MYQHILIFQCIHFQLHFVLLIKSGASSRIHRIPILTIQPPNPMQTKVVRRLDSHRSNIRGANAWQSFVSQGRV